jgi:hypothetical protein
MADPDFIAGRIDTGFVERLLAGEASEQRASGTAAEAELTSRRGRE